ncbi:putative ABC transporter permease [Ruminococcus sp. NK3A76]|uniref:putative ABC transporter permease n=1 Tax=Ruminococcus sp. NK3A76 TaxID=877411 RepID=UPI00049070AC|nr:putative ABC transporter permease [Ruminococcus sp. NK3A76]
MLNTYFERVLTDLPYVGYSLYQMFGIFCFWSVMGWVVEVADMAIEAREFQNRGFLHLPLCPIYGLGVLLLNIILKGFSSNYVLLVIVSMLLCTGVELLVGTALEKAFHARWWDYSHMRFNYKGLICLRNTLFFAAAGFVIVTIIEPKVEEFLDSLVINVGLILMLIFAAMLFIDTMLSLFKARKMRKLGSDYQPTLIFKSHR